jgi:hypothetical protein
MEVTGSKRAQESETKIPVTDYSIVSRQEHDVHPGKFVTDRRITGNLTTLYQLQSRETQNQ